MTSASNSDSFLQLFIRQQEKRQEILLRPIKDRIKVLSNMEKALHRYRDSFREVLYLDFKKPNQETDLTELYPVLSEIRHVKSNLRNWARPQIIPNNLAFTGTRSKVTRNGKGVCLVISPWNYPVSLTLGPLVSAIAAGNTVIIKPSELTPNTSALLKQFVSELFPEDEVALVEGDKSMAEKLLQLPFDHIFFTGSKIAGKKVAQEAASSFASVTLELGGKSPVYIHHDADIPDAVSKLTASKLVNAGQTCVAPDYILVHHDVKQELIEGLQESFKTFYDKHHRGDQKNFASIISTKHYERLEKLTPGIKQPNDLKMGLLFEPILVSEFSMDSDLMKEEIFGPVLPVIGVYNEAEALKVIHSIPEPLSVYIFTASREIKRFFTNNTRSGSICFNDCAVQFLHPGLPFGGIRESGIGRSHGYAGFKAFSNERVIFEQRVGFTMAKLLYPPYNPMKKKIIEWLLKYF